MTNSLNEIITYLPERIAEIFSLIPEYIADEMFEIRLRSSLPVIISGSFGTMFIKSDGSLCRFYNSGCVCAEQSEITLTVNKLCGYSVYSHQSDIAQGFLTFGSGHRAGFSGTAVIQDNKIAAIRNIDGINIRVAKKIQVDTTLVEDLVSSENFNGIIICGPPCSGKTTLLRNIAEKCSSLYSTGYKKTVIIDERFELGNINGINCDLLRGFNKYEGIIYATRVLSPEIIICDEICNEKEAEEIVKCCYSGIKFVISIYSDCPENVFNRTVGKILVGSGFFDYMIFLDRKNMCKNLEILKTGDLSDEYRCNIAGNM